MTLGSDGLVLIIGSRPKRGLRRIVGICAISGTVLGGSVAAQDAEVIPIAAIRHAGGSSYTPRACAQQAVYSASGSTFVRLTSAHRAGDDATFFNPWGLSSFDISGAFFGLNQPAGDLNSSDCTVVLKFYNGFTSWSSGTFPGLTLLGSLSFDLVNAVSPGGGVYWTQYLTPDDPRTVSVPPSGVLVVMEVHAYRSSALHPSIEPLGVSNGPLASSLGTTDGTRWSDSNGDGLVQSGELNAPGTWRALYLSLRASAPIARTPDCTYLHGPCFADNTDGTPCKAPDGGVGVEDLLEYLQLYQSGCGADTDDGSGTGTPDGGVGVEDLLYYLTRYNAGC